MSVPRFLVSVLAAFIFISPANAGDIFDDDKDCPKADTTDKNGITVKGTYATSCKLKPNKCVKTTETQPTTPKGCRKRSYFDKNKKATAETPTPRCAAWKACWDEKKEITTKPGGTAHTNVCNLSTVAEDWMKNQTPLIKDANEKLKLARDALACVIDPTKYSKQCAKIDASKKTDATTQFDLKNFGPTSVRTTNRTDALKKLTTAQTTLFGQIGDIAKQYNPTCRECSVLTDWHLVRTAVYFVNRTQIFSKPEDKVGYSSTKTTVTAGVSKTEPQTYEGRFARDPNGTAYIIDNVKTEAFQSDDYKDTVLPDLKDAVCDVAKASSLSKGQSDIAALAKKLQGSLEELADILAEPKHADWVVSATETDKTKKKLALGAIDKERISGDAKGANMCVNGKKTASYNLPTETIDNTKMSSSRLRSKFETLGIAFCNTGDST